MPLDWESVIGKITRSLSSSSGLKITSTSSPLGPDARAPDFRDRRETRGLIDGHASIRANGAGSKRQRRNMSFADCAQAQDESTAVRRRAALVGMPNDTRIEQCRCFERILVKKIGADQAALSLIQFRMRFERIFHLCRSVLENLE